MTSQTIGQPPPDSGDVAGNDVLESVPALPALQESEASATQAAAHYAAPRRVSIAAAEHDDQLLGTAAAATMATDLAAAPVCLYVARERVPADILAGVLQLARHAPRRNILVAADGPTEQPALGLAHRGSYAVWWWNVTFVHDDSLPSGTLKVSSSSTRFSQHPTRPFHVEIRYVRRCEAFRGLGHVLGVLRSPLIASAAAGTSEEAQASINDEAVMMQSLPVEEKAHFETMGTMIDCSRNGVLNVKTTKFLLKKLALMGYNMLQLYTEDTYKIDDEPFFGYLRGGYTQESLKEIDDYAYDLGIEVIPCIQTLGHLGQMLQWPRYLHLRDTSEVLLADAPETYVMLRKMIVAATRPFRTKKIHLGMDETHGLGHGRYHSIFGQYNHKDPTRIFIDHLARVNAICEELALKPCIWSDMLFCLNARNNSLLGYYDSAQPTKSVEGIPPNVELVYWDYYHTSQESYLSRIHSHRLLSRRNPWMAAGSWTWSRFWTALPFTFATNKASMNACKHATSGVKHVMLTIWADEGCEMDVLSSLPAWSYYAEHGYEKAPEVDLLRLRASFDGICGASFDDYVMASRLDDPSPEKQTIDDGIHFAANTSKWLLYEDPALGFVSPSTQACGLDLEQHYGALATYLEARLHVSTQPVRYSMTADGQRAAPASEYPLNARLRFPALLARTLSYKAGLRYRLHLAYIGMDWDELQRLAGAQPDSRLSRLRDTLRQLTSYHRQMWMATYEPFGWEVLELRYGGLASRLETLHLRVIRFLSHVQRGGRIGVSLSLPRKSGAAEEEGEEDEAAEVMLNPTCGAQVDDYEEEVTSIAELAQPLQVVYGSSDQLLDYHRVSRPTYC